MPERGCDLSYAQKIVDFDALRSEVSFVITKATEGVGFTDATFARNWRETARVGLRRGAYHFARPDLGNSAQDEAGWFLSQLGPLDAADMLALDYEVDWNGDVVGWCKTFLDLVKSVTGITPDIYLNLYLSHVYDWGAIERPGGYPLWLADYDGLSDKVIETPWPSVAIKQWTSIGSLAGIAGNVDLNTMEEDMAFKDDPDAQAFVTDVRNFIDAANKRFALDAHHTHVYAAKQEPSPTAIGGRTSEPLEPPVPGAAYFSSDDSLSMIGWTYPDGTNHFFLNGVEVQK